jgi:hypothetical protein
MDTMNTSAKIDELITRFLDDSLAPGMILPEGTFFDPKKTVSFLAEKELDTLPELYIDVAKKAIEKETNTDRRRQAYHILTRLAERYQDDSSIYYIIRKLESEKAVKLVRDQFYDLWRTGIGLREELERVLPFTRYKDRETRQSAIRLLGRYTVDSGRIEDFLIELIKTRVDVDELCSALGILRKHGSAKCINTVKQTIMRYNDTSLLRTGICLLGELDGPNQTSFFMELMNLKSNSDVKKELTRQVTAYVKDSRAVDILLDRIKSILSRKRKIKWAYHGDQKPEIVHALIYLMNYQDSDQRIIKVINWIIEKKMDFLDEPEAEWINKNIINPG